MQRWFIGLSSGSSVNGIDAALIETHGMGMGLRLRPIHFIHKPYPRELRDLLLRGATGQALAPRQLGTLHRVLGETFAVAAVELVRQAKSSLQQVQCICSPGHMVVHDLEARYPSTLSLGMASVVAERTGVTTLSDIHSRDIVNGGQGFPLTALADALYFHSPSEDRLMLHLGGMASLLWLPAEGGRKVTGFQAAPCTVLLDNMMRQLTSGRESHDAGGKHAVQGCSIDSLLERWLQHPVLQKRPPKTINRLEFGDEFVKQAIGATQGLERPLHDLLCTATHFVAQAVVRAIEQFVPRKPARVLMSGGGVRNGLLWRLLEDQLAPIPLEKLDQYGMPFEAREAVAHAGLAALTMDGVPGNMPSVTGATGARLLGHFTPGSTSNWGSCLAWMAGQNPVMMAAA